MYVYNNFYAFTLLIYLYYTLSDILLKSIPSCGKLGIMMN